MPVFNLAELASLATTFTGRADFTLSETSRLINIAYSELVNKVGHTPLEAIAVSSTTSGENRIAIPTDFNAALALTMYVGSTATNSNATTVVVLPSREARWLDARDRERATTGEPEAYVQYATWIELWPSPTSAYSLWLRYSAKPAMLVESTDTPALDERWQTAIALRTTELLAAARLDYENEALARNRYLNFVNSMPTDRARKQEDKAGMTARFTWRNLGPD